VLYENAKYSSGTDATAGNVLIISTISGAGAADTVLVCKHTDSQADSTITTQAYTSATDPLYFATNVKSCAIAFKSGTTAVTAHNALVTGAASACTATVGAATKADRVESATAYDFTFTSVVLGCKVGPYNLTTLNAKGISFQLVTLPAST
jgi:hypothetical protein